MANHGERQSVPHELRSRAALARRAASVPTTGSWRVDRVLVAFAERLELEASVLEQETTVGAQEETTVGAQEETTVGAQEETTVGAQENGCRSGRANAE